MKSDQNTNKILQCSTFWNFIFVSSFLLFSGGLRQCERMYTPWATFAHISTCFSHTRVFGPAEPCLFQLLPGLLLGRGVVRNISAFGHRFGGFKDTINYFLHVCGDTYFGHGRAVHPPHFHVLMWTEILSRVRSVARAIVPKQVTHTFIFFSH